MGCGISKSGPDGGDRGAGVVHDDQDVIDEDDVNSDTNQDQRSEDHHHHRDVDALASPRSPSFREYCTTHSPIPMEENTHNLLADDDDFHDIHPRANRETHKGSSDEVEFGKKEKKGRSSTTSGIRNIVLAKQAKLISYLNATRHHSNTHNTPSQQTPHQLRT